MTFWLLVALSCSSTPNTNGTSSEDPEAHGRLYVDDGVTPVDQNPRADQLQMTASAHHLTVTRVTSSDVISPGLCDTGLSTVIDIVRVYGVQTLTEVTVGGAVITSWSLNSDTDALTISNIGYDWCSNSPLDITWE
ncbi:uncharacterized protein [Panulirus ornatus]|uniref:uncharacterized protein n=1 Tax=Panulirus ornatus TaxID=150431 RepID=UPI003A897AC0